MLHRNDQTNKWDYKVPVDTSCMNTEEGCPVKHLKASTEALHDIGLVSYPHQPAEMRMYMPGYEDHFNKIPVLEPNDVNLEEKFNIAKSAVSVLADELSVTPWVLNESVPAGKFHRHIIAIEKPETGMLFGDYGEYVTKQGKEFVVAHWGDGFVSPVHGHAPGLEIEEMLSGKLIVNRYNMVAPDSNVVRLASSVLYSGRQTIEFDFTQANENDYFDRQKLIHSFKSVGYSASLHYVPEHSRDGMGNTFIVEYFENVHTLDNTNTTRLTLEEALKLKPGAVALVRSKNVNDYGDHFIVITGGLIEKQHGLRQQDIVIVTEKNMDILNQEGDLVFLKLSNDIAEKFIAFHNITIEEPVVNFDDHYDLHFDQVKQISTEQGMYSKRLDVLLVRSKSLPEMGDHYVVITGHAVQKDHGIRPQTAVFPAMDNSPLLDVYDSTANNAVLLKLNNEAAQAFLDFYQIHLDESSNVVSKKMPLQLA